MSRPSSFGHGRWIVSLALAGSLAVAVALPAPASAGRYEAARLGSFLGAMKHCEERYDEKERRYRRARLRAARELDDMSKRERARAYHALEQSFDRGRFMGNRLDRNECRSLLRASEWRHFSGD